MPEPWNKLYLHTWITSQTYA